MYKSTQIDGLLPLPCLSWTSRGHGAAWRTIYHLYSFWAGPQPQSGACQLQPVLLYPRVSLRKLRGPATS